MIQYPVIYNEWFILSHEPVYINSNMPYANIYGHVHSNPSYADYSAQSFCVSAERINYTPIEFSQIIIMYVVADGENMFLVHACKKQKGKAEKFELDTAIKRVKELEKELGKRFI